MLDEYWFGDTGRISPEAPVPVVKTRATDQRPGGAANVALNVAALGGQVRLLAVVGDDARAEVLTQLLSSAGVHCNFIEASGLPTIHKLRVLSRNQQLIRLDSEELLVGHEEAFATSYAGSLQDVDAIVFSDYGKGTLSRIEPLVALGREHGIPVIVDGAHAYGQFAFKHEDLDCDYYGTSLHKWLFAPHGTGLLYVRRDRIKETWPMMGAQESEDNDIRKFEQIGTHPAANALAIGEAITFHEGIGIARKEARLRHLRDLWARRLARKSRIRLHTSLDPRFSCAIATVEIDGIPVDDLSTYLASEHRILTAPIKHTQFQGIRISPSVYTTVSELEKFCDVMERVALDGLPG